LNGVNTTSVSARAAAGASSAWRTVIGVTALALALSNWVGVSPAAAHPSAAPLAVHLKITGGFRFSGTLSNFYSGFDHFCATGPDTSNPGTQLYVLYYGLSALTDALKGNFARDAVVLIVRQYRPTRTHYSEPDLDSLQVVIQHHAYSHVLSTNDLKYAIKIDIARNGLSGKFTVSHITAMAKFHGKPVNIQGSWTCDTLLRTR
jgi:hypothetical protein